MDRCSARLFVLITASLCISSAARMQSAAPVAGIAAPKTAVMSKPLSERVVAYQIDAHVDTRRKTIDATEVLTYHNLTGHLQDTFPFHLYLNAFQPTSTLMREIRRDRPQFEWQDKYRALAEVKSFEVAGIGDLTSQIRFISPDDGNPEDRTVFQVKLTRPVAPGESVQFKIAFRDQLGVVFERTGYKRDFIMGAQWFPKVGVWWQGNNPDGTKTVTFHGEDIHDFAWTAEPEFRIFSDTFSGSAGAVRIRLLMQPGHVALAERHMRIMKETMKRFDEWYGPYPYKQITVVDPPHGGGLRAGGMEYPTLITGGTTWWMPKGWHLLEEVVEHEFGHQYWYGMVASNEFEDAWLDEGINSYTECKVLDDIYGKDRSALDLWGVTRGDDAEQRATYLSAADKDPMARFAYQYLNSTSYGGITYGKTATVLLTLEKIIGEDTMRRALHTYFMRYRFTHPTKEDFLKTVEEVSGQNLRWYFDQAVYGTQVMDYEILRAASDRVEWYQKNPPQQKKSETLYRTTVLVHRKGEFIFPVDVLLKFDNGETVREHWDGRDRWVRYTYDKTAKLVSAELDPKHQVGLDKDFFNNSYVKEQQSGARRKLASYWLVFTQVLGQLLAWLV